MKEKIIIFGLGTRFRQFREKLEHMFDVVGYSSNCSSDAENLDGFISPGTIPEVDFEKIVICCDSEIEIYNQLTTEIKIPNEKIAWYRLIYNDKGDFWSEHNEDALAMVLLQRMGRNHFYYLDLGANHPVIGSNTYAFYRRGSGILVEANPELAGFIRWLRPKDRLINKAVTADGEDVVFYRLKQSGLGTINYSNLDEQIKKKHDNFEIKQKYEISGITIGSIICSLETNTPDLFSIDIEGMDWTVLHSIDFSTFRPRVIISETVSWGYYQHTPEDFDVFFSDNDYIKFHFNGGNTIYYDRKYKDLVE